MLPLLTALLGGCSLPSLEGRSQSSAIAPGQTAQSPLGQVLTEQALAHPEQSGILPLPGARDAFASRILLARAAQQTLDVQYYIWHHDITGTLLLQALLQAAERGVRVRLLLDDNGISGMDDLLAALDSHPHIEVRLFNPFSLRKAKALGYLTHFSRANRRMHNKSFTADNQATIIGGRNIGDEYFGATEGVLFADLDVLAAGAVVPQVSSDFDRYWASDSAYPIARILPKRTPRDLPALTRAANHAEQAPGAEKYLQALRESTFIDDLLAGRLALQWSDVRMVSDDPRKGLGLAAKEELLLFRLGQILGTPQTDVELVSPYFVPTAAGVEAFSRLAANGVKIRVLTNALEATDVAAVHAGYGKRRKALLEAGIVLYEMRRQADSGQPRESAGPFGSSGSSLHAKTFSVDRQRIFVGSFNFDPRSANLNTELGFVIENPTLASTVETAFDEAIPANAYAVHLDEKGQLYWLERQGEQLIRHDSEPGAGPLKRFGVRLLEYLPIEWLL